MILYYTAEIIVNAYLIFSKLILKSWTFQKWQLSMDEMKFAIFQNSKYR